MQQRTNKGAKSHAATEMGTQNCRQGRPMELTGRRKNEDVVTLVALKG